MNETKAHNPKTVSNMRVLMGCDTFAPDVNGAARFTERLCAGLKKRGVEVIVVAPAPSKKEVGLRQEVIEGEALQVFRLPSHKLWGHEWLRFVFPWTSRKSLNEIIESVKPDVVHIQSHFLIGRSAANKAAKSGVRVVATNHVMLENILDLKKMPAPLKRAVRKGLWADARRVIRKAAAVTTPTRKAANFLENNTGIRGVLPISCGLDASEYTPRFERPTNPVMVFVGRLNQEKQIDVALRALSRIPAEANLTFEVVGGGDQQENLKRLAEDLGVSERVTWHGKAADKKLREVLSSATFFVMPSIAELQSIATLEAMASGLPVIAANAMALPHLVDEGVNGYLFKPGDDGDLAEAITELLSKSTEEYLDLKRASLEMVSAHDIQETLNAFLRIYQGAVSDRNF